MAAIRTMGLAPVLPPDVDSGRVTAVYHPWKLEIRAPRISTRTTARRVPISRPPTYNFEGTGS